MEHLDSVTLGVLDICALVWYACQRARRWLLRAGWIAGAMLGFVLVGPLALVMWIAASGLFGPKLRNDGKRKQYRWIDIGDTQNADLVHSPGFHFNYRTGEFDAGLDPDGIYIDSSHP